MRKRRAPFIALVVTLAAVALGAARATTFGTMSSPAAGKATTACGADFSASAEGAKTKETATRRTVVPTTRRNPIAIILRGCSAGYPGIEYEADPRAAAGLAVDLQLAPEHLDALEHARKAETA